MKISISTVLLVAFAVTLTCLSDIKTSIDTANAMSLDNREKLISEIKAIGLPQEIKEIPTVSLESFFIGNDDLGSIGCNLLEHPGTPFFYETLKNIRARKDVHDVLVGIHEVEEADHTMWPFSEQIYIITNLHREKISDLVSPLQPDDISEVSIEKILPKPKILSGYKVLEVWWD